MEHTRIIPGIMEHTAYKNKRVVYIWRTVSWHFGWTEELAWLVAFSLLHAFLCAGLFAWSSSSPSSYCCSISASTAQNPTHTERREYGKQQYMSSCLVHFVWCSPRSEKFRPKPKPACTHTFDK